MASSGDVEVEAEGASGTSTAAVISWGPRDDVTYPLNVIYCNVCGFPPEFCENGSEFEQCKAWLEESLPDLFSRLYSGAEGDSSEDKKKGRQKRGGKANKGAKKAVEAEKKIGLATATRGKKKTITVVTGLGTYGLDLKKASKALGQKFACGASISGPDEISIQGDFKYDLFDFLPQKWSEIDEDTIEDLGDTKK